MARLHLLFACLCSTTVALVVPPKPNLRPQPQAAISTAGLKHRVYTAVASAPLFASLPAFADGDASDLDPLNLILSVFVGAFVLFIGKFAVEAATEVGSQVEERSERLGLGKGGGGRSSPKIIYEDVDYSYKELSKPVENSRTRKKESKQIKADGTRFAPWMVIDEKMTEKVKKERRENKKKTGKFFG